MPPRSEAQSLPLHAQLPLRLLKAGLDRPGHAAGALYHLSGASGPHIFAPVRITQSDLRTGPECLSALEWRLAAPIMVAQAQPIGLVGRIWRPRWCRRSVPNPAAAEATQGKANWKPGRATRSLPPGSEQPWARRPPSTGLISPGQWHLDCCQG